MRQPGPGPALKPSFGTQMLSSSQILRAILLRQREPVEYLSTVESCTVEKSAIDEFGSIAHGRLTTTGLVAEGVLEREVESHDDGERIVHYACLSGFRLPVASDYLLDYDNPGQTPTGTPVFLLRMSNLQWGRKNPKTSLISLVLRRSLDTPGAFKCIGTSKLTVNRDSVDPRREVFDKAALQNLVIV
jgi:hypothetical protein